MRLFFRLPMYPYANIFQELLKEVVLWSMHTIRTHTYNYGLKIFKSMLIIQIETQPTSKADFPANPFANYNDNLIAIPFANLGAS